MLVNIGDLLQRWTADKYPSTVRAWLEMDSSCHEAKGLLMGASRSIVSRFCLELVNFCLNPMDSSYADDCMLQSISVRCTRVYTLGKGHVRFVPSLRIKTVMEKCLMGNIQV